MAYTLHCLYGFWVCLLFSMTGKATNQENTRELALYATLQDETRRKTDPEESHEKSLIIVGSKEVGKTTMVHRFLEKEDTPRATLAMDYSYGRKAGKSLVKDVVHVWEVGHLTSSLISGAMRGCTLSHSAHHTTILIMLDLAKSDVLWNSLEDCLVAVRSSMLMTYQQELVQDLRERKIRYLRERAKSGTEDETLVDDPFPMRLCIIGGKYDEFRELYTGDDKESIGQALRAAAHVLGAGLHYHSAKDSHLLRRTKELLSHYGFKGQSTKASVTEYDKPLSIAAGSDCFAAIDLKVSRDRYAATLDEIKQIYVMRFPQVPRDQDVSSGNMDDPATDPNFNEPIIDRLRLQREQEISVLLRDMLEAPPANIPIPEPY